MTQFVIADFVNTQLAAAAASTATTLTLASSTNLPTLSAGQVMPLILNDAATGQSYEIVYVTAITGVTLTVMRAQEGTGALNWNVGDYAWCGPTSGTVATSLGNPNNVFAVAPATVSNQAVQYGQMLAGGYTITNSVTFTSGIASNGTITANGGVVIPNNVVGYQAKAVSGAAFTIAYMDSSNNCNLGNTGLNVNINGTVTVPNAPIKVVAATSAGQAMSEAQSFGSPLQTYQSLSASRAIGTTYTNSTGRPIFVGIAASSGAAGSSIGLFVSGIGEISVSSASGAALALCVNGIIPPGATYVVNQTGTASTLTTWNEYR